MRSSASHVNTSGTASQRAEKSDRLCPQYQVGEVAVKMGTGNLGLHQNQIESNGFQRDGKILQNFKRVIAKCFDEGELHNLNLCEVGGHRQGLEAIHCEASSIIDGALQANHFGSCAQQAYMSVWVEAGVSDWDGTKLNPVGEPVVIALAPETIMDPQMVLTTYMVTTCLQHGQGALVVGQLHIRTPHNEKSPSIKTRQELVKTALDIITGAVNDAYMRSCVDALRTVAVVCGDVNLTPEQADADGNPQTATQTRAFIGTRRRRLQVSAVILPFFWDVTPNLSILRLVTAIVTVASEKTAMIFSASP